MSTSAEQPQPLTPAEAEELRTDLEAALAEDVQAALTLTADDFAEAVQDASELVAAAFSVSRIRGMWQRRVGGILDRLRGIARVGAGVASTDVGEDTPAPEALEPVVEPYVAATEALLNAVGDRLATDAVVSLNEGLAAGESLPELKARMTELFRNDGTELGPGRAQRIAATESTRAFNAGALAAAQALTGPERPVVKQWQTSRDERVRVAHREVDGQIQFLDDPFDVGGTEMLYPGDPSAPADLTVNCRCILRLETAPSERTASMDGPEDELTAAAHTGAMIALIPTEADAARLAVDGGEAANQLHVTLSYLGDAADWSDEARADVVTVVRTSADWLSLVHANVFGIARWNPTRPEPVWVWNVGDAAGDDSVGSSLGAVHSEVRYALSERGIEIPEQYSPWVPHIAATYGAVEQSDMDNGLGPVTFDRIRVAFGAEYTDIPLPVPEVVTEPWTDADPDLTPGIATWSTPGDTALAFENQQTGDGRVFAPDALRWSEGPWPLMANDGFSSHDDTGLAGAIHTLGRAGDRITADGVLYLDKDAGFEAVLTLAQGGPLGVSVDLDNVDIEFVDASGNASGDDAAAPAMFTTRLARASVLPVSGGGYQVSGETVPVMTAGAGVLVASRRIVFEVAADGRVSRDIVAAAGDPDVLDGVVVDQQNTGDFLMRIVRGRVRGATLVTVPAFAEARIVLDRPELFASAATDVADDVTAAAQQTDYERVLRHARRSKRPVGAARVARSLRLHVHTVQRHLATAASRGELVRLTRGLYTDATTSARADHVMDDDLLTDAPGVSQVTAAVTGAVVLPVAAPDTEWDADAAAARVFEWADGDCDRIGDAFAWRDDDADCAQRGAYKLGYADVIDGTLAIVPNGVSAAWGAVQGARGGVDLPDGDVDAVRERLESVRAHVAEVNEGDDMNDLTASAWAAMADLPPMPAAWFREPTAEELPPGGAGVNYANGRIFGWVAQAGEAHAGYAKKVTIEGLGRIDTTHFLRQKFTLDNGEVVRAGAFTMNVGHHRDGAECETAVCQFDDTRTVAGIVTVGMNERGMWFSGAAAPWLSEWDRSVFMATQPSYHMRKGSNGKWQLRAVLAVPVPGHSSPLLASAVAERAQLALTAAATMHEVDAAIAAEEERQLAEVLTEDVAASAGAATEAAPEVQPGLSPTDPKGLAELIATAAASAVEAVFARRDREAAELRELMQEAATMGDDVAGTEGN